LDAGTTVLELARRIKPDLDLTIVSIGLPSALDLASRGNNSILTPGGEVNSRNFAVEGNGQLKTSKDLPLM
jgi:DeoR family fructose operon transcriptional repressor